MTELGWGSVAELCRLIRARKVSPVEVVRAYLDRIERLDPTFKVFITLCEKDALAAAKEAEAAVMSGGALGLLHGAPIGLKDLFDTRGVRTTGGSKILAERLPEEDATVVARLKEAGAIVLGKLHMHEFAYGPEGVNLHYGTPRNPWDPTRHRIPGGSSSGSGVAVALSLAGAALGTDTGGSIRIPASLCGIVGLKPTYGRVSRAGVLPLSWSLDHAGPMTRTVEDAALMLESIAGHDPSDRSSSVLPVPDYSAPLTENVKGLKAGLVREFFDAADSEVRGAVELAAERLEELGMRIEEVRLPTAPYVAGAAFAIVAAEALAYHEAWLRARPEDYGADVRNRLRTGLFVTAAHYVKAQRARRLIHQEVDRALGSVACLIAPTTPITATPVGERSVTVNGRMEGVRPSLLRFTRLFNLTGHPALSVPCGFSADGLPIGMQIAGRAFDEATVLRIGHAFEKATEWHVRRPPLA